MARAQRRASNAECRMQNAELEAEQFCILHSAFCIRPAAVIATATATSAHANASLLARVTSVSHVGMNATSAAATRPLLPHQRSPIVAVATIAINAKTTLAKRQTRNRVSTVRGNSRASGATSE